MPALNEEANVGIALGRCLRAFDEYRLSGEVVVVNDGSRDSTPAKVEEWMERDGRVRVVHHRRSQGIGASFRDGLAEARGEAVAMIPGDNENEPGGILQYCHLLRQVDLVIPFVYNRGVRSAARNLLSGLYLAIVNATFGLHFNYTNGTVLYRRSILKGSENRSNGFFFQTENIVRLVRKGYLFAEVPYRLDRRGGGDSKATSLRSLRAVIKDYLGLVKEVYFSAKDSGELAADSVACRERS